MRTGVVERMQASVTTIAHRAVVVLVLVAVLPPLPSTAQTLAAIPAPTLTATAAGPARAIVAWTEFCARYSGECEVDRDAPARIVLTPAIWATINGVNRRVNRAMEAVTDQDHWGVPDRWDLAEDGKGDCEDFQLLKRRMLVEAGLSRRAMRMTVVIDEKGEGHAVLTILTSRGDLILDNKTNAVLPWAQTGYTFIKRESQETVGWVALSPNVSPVTTANR